MRMPSTHSSSYAFVVGISVLLTGAMMRWGIPAAASPAELPPAPRGEVEVGPLMMGSSLPLELLTQELGPLFPNENALYGGGPYGDDAEEAEETSFIHLGGPFGEPFGDFGRAFPGEGAPSYAWLQMLGGHDHEGHGHEGVIEAFGAPLPTGLHTAAVPPMGFGGGGGRPGGRSLLAAPRPLLSLAAPASPLAPWLALFSAADQREQPLAPSFPRGGQAEAIPLRVTLPPVFLNALAGTSGRPVFGGVDYSDPSGIGLPLLRVFGYEDAPLSSHFRVRDFATHDGAPLARISPRLVQGLERLRQSTGAFYVISGYRHPSYNAAVGGSRVSRHMAGQAADLWSPTASSIELARAAVASFGCGIGLGLGRNTLHVDVRGHLSTWTYPGAPLSETTFDLWVLMLCERVNAADLNNLLQVEWALPDSLSDTDLLNRLRWLTEDAARPDSVTRQDAEQLLQRRRLVLAAYARNGMRGRGPGAVFVDLSGGLPPDAASLTLRYVPADAPEAARLGITPLVEWVVSQRHQQSYFVYVVHFPDGRTYVGIMTMSAADVPPPSPSASPATPGGASPRPASPASPSRSAPRPATGWGIVVNSTSDPVEAERDAARYRQLLAGTGYEVTLRVTEGDRPRYRVAVGAFAGAEDAREATSTTLAGRVPDDAWLLPPDY